MKNILLLDYSTDQNSAAAFRRWLPCGVRVTDRFVDEHETSLSDVDPGAFTHIVHSGSALSIVDDAPFSKAAEDLIREAARCGIAQMGICFGHQLLCRSLVGKHAVRHTPKGLEVGWGQVEFTDLGQQLLAVGQSERVWQYHFDEVTALPAGSELVATNSHSTIQAFINENTKLIGTQFHPEFDQQEGNRVFREDHESLAKQNVDAAELIRGTPTIASGPLFFGFFLRM